MAKTTKPKAKKAALEPPAFKIFDSKGRYRPEIKLSLPTPLSINSGDFLINEDAQGVLRFGLFWNKSIVQYGSEWRAQGNISLFEHGSMTEAQLYAFRRKLLKKGGHI